jgi:hypothetical protein
MVWAATATAYPAETRKILAHTVALQLIREQRRWFVSKKRGRLRSTTMLTGAVGCAFFVGSVAHAELLFTKAPLATVAPGPAPAVDGVNEKFDVFGGSVANRNIYGTRGSLDVPLAGPYGLQIDGNLGSLSGNTYGAGAGHLFWRNPGQGLFGVYGSFTEWNQQGGVWVSQIAGEGAVYWGRLTLEGIVGVEFGNSVNSTTTLTSIVPPSGPPGFPRCRDP